MTLLHFSSGELRFRESGTEAPDNHESSLAHVLHLKGNLVFALGQKELILQRNIEDVMFNVGEFKAFAFQIEPLYTDWKPMLL